MVRIEALHAPARKLAIGTTLLASILISNLANAQDRGMSMDQVREVRGEPSQVKGPVGDPPITQWHYADDILYFEYDKLLETVPKNNKPKLLRQEGLRRDSARKANQFYYK